MKLIAAALAGLITVPALACNSFGPDYDPTPCPDNPPGPVERIPITGWDYPYEAAIRQNDQWIAINLPVTVMVIDDFVFMYATLPNGAKISGVSNQCIQDSCPYLANYARRDMEYKLDAVLRFANLP